MSPDQETPVDLVPPIASFWSLPKRSMPITSIWKRRGSATC